MFTKHNKLVSGLCLLGLTVVAAPNAMALNQDIGGYVDRAESRFVRNVWNFVKNFQGYQKIGAHSYKTSQYYYAEPYMFDSLHRSFVDKMDVAFVAGHGNKHYIQTTQSKKEGVDLRFVPAYGDLINNGDLEFMIIESCFTVASAPESADWWTPYSSMFKGIHQLVGFHTLSNSDNGIPNNFANKLKANGGVWQSWFAAVNEERYWIFNPTNSDDSPYPGLASAIVYNSTQNDRLGSYAPDPSGIAGMKTWWQY
jgi:hypothetical protein